MNWDTLLYPTDEQPLDRLTDGYSHTSIFRRIAFIGDSLSSGEFETRDRDGNAAYHDFYDYSWGQFIARKNGLTAYNFSRGGMTAEEYLDRFAEEQGFWDSAKACQAYVIALGVNDLFNRRMPLGTLDDVHPDDPSKNAPTFLGQYAAIVSRYKAIAPDATFFFVTFPHLVEPELEETVQGMIKGLYGLSERFDNTYVIDLYRYGPVYDARFQEQFYRHGHMSPAGYLLTARLIDSYIDYIVRHHPQQFKHIGFVGTDIPYDRGGQWYGE